MMLKCISSVNKMNIFSKIAKTVKKLKPQVNPIPVEKVISPQIVSPKILSVESATEINKIAVNSAIQKTAVQLKQEAEQPNRKICSTTA